LKRILVFGGTSEGRELSEFLNEKKIMTLVCVVSEYGRKLIAQNEYISVREGSLNEKQIEDLISAESFTCVIDCTHPFAKEVSENIRTACQNRNTEYVRLARKTDCKESVFEDVKAVWVDDMSLAAEFFASNRGNIFITTGSHNIEKLSVITEFRNRAYVRILPNTESIEKCIASGIDEKKIICMHGPFSAALNECMLRETKAKYILTKESGKEGGFAEKITAAGKLGITAVIIKNTENEGLSLEQVKALINEKYAYDKHVNIIGAGCGNFSLLTEKSKNMIDESSVIFGSKRIVEPFKRQGKQCIESFNANEIAEKIENSQNDCFSVLYSGDIGFYSGAAGLIKLLEEKKIRYSVSPGISSYVYFMAKLGKSYENTVFLSLHGAKCDYIEAVKHNEKCLIIVGDGNSINEICGKLIKNSLEKVTVYIGENLSYPDEKISEGEPIKFVNEKFSHLSLVYIENHVKKAMKIAIGMDDTNFIRSKVPMTKSEVRAIIISKLKLDENSVVYDIGAGTGSVSIECALAAQKGRVYSVEKDIQAAELLNKNKNNFKIENLDIVFGMAPEVLKDIKTVPTHCFIGGSMGKLKEIIEYTRSLNNNIRYVVSAVTLETLEQTNNITEILGYKNVEIIQASISRGEKIGSHTMLKAENPIYIISFGGEEK